MQKTGNIIRNNHIFDASITPAERERLRALSGRVAQLADRDIEKEKQLLWQRHNDLEKTRPLIFCDPENGWHEIITEDALQCRNPLPRDWEYRLLKEIFWGEKMGDDRVIQPWFNLGYICTETDWGVHEKQVGGDHNGARTWIAPLTQLDDLSMLCHPTINVDRPATEQLIALAQNTFGDLLPVRLRPNWYWTLGMTWELINLRGLENFMLDMYDHPEGLHRLMAFLRDGTLNKIKFLEDNGLYSLNNEGDYVGSGAFGWSAQLPAPGFQGRVRNRDLWCLSESQETVGVSPDLFEEFVFRYQVPIMEKFGRVCYGCCEPVHERWHLLRQIKNLRRVSVSPWCDRAKMAEYLGNRYVYSLKPHPGLVAGEHFDPEAIRNDARNALDTAKGCNLELVMKDNHTIRNEPRRVVEWCRIVREEIEKAGA